MDNIIVIENIVKRFGDHTAVDGLSLDIGRGEIFGFLGPNGAGKTTTVRLMTTLANLDEGRIVIDGHDISKDPIKAKRCLGLIQQNVSLDKELTVYENMMHHAMFQKIPKAERRKRIEELIEYVELDRYRDYMVNSLSGGWKKRVAIVCSLLHNPKILFLDEPTVGLDIDARRKLWDLIKKMNKDGTTVFLTTHYIEEAEAICDRVGIIDNGRLIALDSPKELRNRIGRMAVEYYGEDGKTEYRYFPGRQEANDFATNLGNDYTVIVRRTNLEDCFVEITGKKVGGLR